jgi:F-type H+-transporting ATPase subunit gamma
MANLKEVRDRIQSVISTQQITKAMKLVAASKLRKAQQAVLQLRPYSQKLNAILSNIVSTMQDDDDASVFGIERVVKKVCIVVITSNRGLCGAFNTNVIKAAKAIIDTKYQEQYQQGQLTFLFIGKKGKDVLAKRFPNAHCITDYVELVGKEFSSNDSMPIAERLMNSFVHEEFDAVEIAYARFRNAAMQDYEVEAFLPLQKSEKTVETAFDSDFIFEPQKEELLAHLIPAVLKTQFHKTILDSTASEHGARMTAMDKATDNAEELLKELRINYNKARQEAITTELGEIVGGAAALEA